MPFDDTMRRLLLRLWGAGAVKVDLKNGFNLKKHEKEPWRRPSPIKVVLATPAGRLEGTLTEADINNIGKRLWWTAEEKRLAYTGVAGIPNVGNPLAKCLVAEAYHEAGGREVAQLTLTKIEEGGKRHIGDVIKVMPELPEDEKVLIIDDVATKGESKEEAVESIRRAGYKVTDCLVFIDREEGAARNLEKIGVRLHSAITLRRMVSFYHEQNLMGDHEAKLIRAYLDETNEAAHA